MITSSIAEMSIPERLTASRIATAPSSGAVSGARPPRNLPIGVRAAATITGCRDESVMWFGLQSWGCLGEKLTGMAGGGYRRADIGYRISDVRCPAPGATTQGQMAA